MTGTSPCNREQPKSGPSAWGQGFGCGLMAVSHLHPLSTHRPALPLHLLHLLACSWCRPVPAELRWRMVSAAGRLCSIHAPVLLAAPTQRTNQRRRCTLQYICKSADPAQKRFASATLGQDSTLICFAPMQMTQHHVQVSYGFMHH